MAVRAVVGTRLGYVFFRNFEFLLVSSVTFPLVLGMRRGGRGRRRMMVLRDRLFVNRSVAFLRVGRGEDTYRDRDARFKVQVASLSDSPGDLVVRTLE